MEYARSLSREPERVAAIWCTLRMYAYEGCFIKVVQWLTAPLLLEKITLIYNLGMTSQWNKLRDAMTLLCGRLPM
jgi:hypothetical protein